MLMQSVANLQHVLTGLQSRGEGKIAVFAEDVQFESLD
jgi:hypothetical protein